MDPMEMARRVLGMAAEEPVEQDLTDVAEAELRPCVECGEPTALVVFDPDTLELVPALCAGCEKALLDVAWAVIVSDEQLA